MSKLRPKKSSEKGKKERRQRIFNVTVLAVVLVIIISVTAYQLSRETAVPLPPYLDRCVPLAASLVYDSRPQLRVNIYGAARPVPAGIGVEGNCVRPVSTFGSTGTIHVLTDVNRTYTLGDFFNMWGHSYGSYFSTFNKNQIFDYKTDNVHSITVTISDNGAIGPDYRFQDYPFPRNANTTSHPVIIVIDYH